MNSIWLEIRDASGRLLFKYDPINNQVELRRGSIAYELIKLDEIRKRHGVPVETPVQVDGIVVVQMVSRTS